MPQQILEIFKMIKMKVAGQELLIYGLQIPHISINRAKELPCYLKRF